MKPTRLYIKRHRVTGLMYFGKSVSNLIESYHGSGKYWKRHVAKHGKEHIEHVWSSEWFTDENEVKEFALSFSELFNIVNSDEWANLKEENGLDGGDNSMFRQYLPFSEEQLFKLRQPRPNARKPKSTETRARMSIAQQNMSDETKAKLSASLKGKKKSKEHIAKFAYAMSMGWIVTTPSGEVLKVVSLSKFCREHNLSAGSLRGVAIGQRKQHKGYTCVGPINKETLFKD